MRIDRVASVRASFPKTIARGERPGSWHMGELDADEVCLTLRMEEGQEGRCHYDYRVYVSASDICAMIKMLSKHAGQSTYRSNDVIQWLQPTLEDLRSLVAAIEAGAAEK